MTLLVNLLGIGLIAFIIWWFWLSKSRNNTIRNQEAIEIIVESGIYAPSSIEVAGDKPVKLTFIKDPSPCAEKVIFPQLGISADLPLKNETALELPRAVKGEYEFTCQMGMYRGTLIVK